MAPSCTIIIPVFNDDGYLAEALASVCAQTVTDWEAVVVDDGSTGDDAAALVAALDDPRFRFIRHPENRGLSAARNTAIRDARAEIIVPLDADDALEPGYLERVLPFLAPDTGFNCAFTDYLGFGGFNGVLRQGVHRHEGVVEYSPEELLTLLRFQWIPAGGGSFTRSLWEAVGGYSEDAALRIGNEDRDFWVGALERGLRPVYIAEPLYRYRVGHASMMGRLAPATWKTHRAIYERHRDIFDRNGATRGFLADGYVRSAEAVRESGARRRAMRLAFRALGHQPWRVDAYGVIGRALLPTVIHDRLRGARQRLRGGAA